MPIYTAKCVNCENKQDYISTISERDNTPTCESCGDKTNKIITPTKIHVEFGALTDGYISPATGEYIDTSKKRKEDFRKSGTRPWEGMESERKESIKAKQEAKDKERKETRKAAEKAVAQLDL